MAVIEASKCARMGEARSMGGAKKIVIVIILLPWWWHSRLYYSRGDTGARMEACKYNLGVAPTY